jgi:hypothetical protein
MSLSGLAGPRATEPKTRGRAIACGRTALRVASSLVRPEPFGLPSGSMIGRRCDTDAECQRFELLDPRSTTWDEALLPKATGVA